MAAFDDIERSSAPPLGLTPQIVADAVCPVLDTWPVARAWLYGSVARGEQCASSDVDIAIEVVDGERIGLSAYWLQDELECALGCDVDVQTVPNRRMASQAFVKEFDRDKVLVYERT